MSTFISKINPIQLGLTALLFALILGFIPAENGMDMDATISKIAGLIVVSQLFNWATARHAILELEKLDLGVQLNRVFDTAKLIVNAMGSTEPATNMSQQPTIVTTTTVQSPNVANPALAKDTPPVTGLPLAERYRVTPMVPTSAEQVAVGLQEVAAQYLEDEPGASG